MKELHPDAQVALCICLPLAIAWIVTTFFKEVNK